MHALRSLSLALALLTVGLLSTPAGAEPAKDPQGQLEQYAAAKKIDFPEQAVSFFQKLVDAGCSPESAYRWVRMALFADEDWNLSDLAGMVEVQLLEGATRQVVEAEVEKRIAARAKEMDADLARFPAAFAAGDADAAPAKKGGKKKR